MNRAIRRSILAAASCAALALPAPAAHAQTPRGLISNLRLVCYAGGSMQDVRSPNAWVTASPLVTNVTGSDVGSSDRYSNGNFTAVADYGRLRVYGSGSAQSAPGAGDFLILSQWIGGAPQAEYRDRIYVTSPTLAVGTPVTLRFGLVLAGSSAVVDASPTNDVSAVLYVYGKSFSLSLTAPGSTSGTVGAAVGDSLDVDGQLFVDLAANNLASGASPYDGSIACDLVATFPDSSLTPGVVLTSNSNTLAVPDAPRAGAAFALAGAAPNPAPDGRLALRFALPSAAPATLALYDLAGREVARQDVGALGAGEHVVELAHGITLAPGVYLARLAQGGQARTARVTVVR